MRRTHKAQYRRGDDSKMKDSISWVPGMKLGPGGYVAGIGNEPPPPAIRERFTSGPRWTYEGKQGHVQVRWVCPMPEYDQDLFATSRVIEQAAKRFGMKIAWVMCGLHSKVTTARRHTTNGGWKRDMADDDLHTTVRFCKSDGQTCYLHGHLYVYAHKEEVADHGSHGETEMIDIAERLATVKERTFVGGQPFHVWIWGPYPPESKNWPRVGTNLPKPPFRRKHEYKHLDINVMAELKELEDNSPVERAADPNAFNQKPPDRGEYQQAPLKRQEAHRAPLERRDRYERPLGRRESYQAHLDTSLEDQQPRKRKHEEEGIDEEEHEARIRQDRRHAAMSERSKRDEYR